eukprot:1364570-Rhodomonas_salina.2
MCIRDSFSANNYPRACYGKSVWHFSVPPSVLTFPPRFACLDFKSQKPSSSPSHFNHQSRALSYLLTPHVTIITKTPQTVPASTFLKSSLPLRDLVFSLDS